MASRTIIGCDIGGSKCAVARYRLEDFAEEAYEQILTPRAEGFAHVLETVSTLTDKMVTPGTVALGMGVPGLVQTADGMVLTMPNIPGSNGFMLNTRLSARFPFPTVTENDARCFTLAEALHGAGKGKECVVGITLGTGVGGGIALHGELFRGAHGFAGEIGHMLLQPGQPPYPTQDNRGDAEQFLSGTALGKRCAAAKRPEEYLDGEVCDFLQPSLFREAAWLITSITHVLDPSVVVFGGSTGKALRPHIPAIQKELHVWMLPGMPVPALSVSDLEHPGCLGAALLASRLTPRA